MNTVAANATDLYSAAALRCLLELDVRAMRKLHEHVNPHLPRVSDESILGSLHYARTTNRQVPLNLRAYSHRWLLDHDLPTGLPDELRPRAERLYPRIAAATGFSANFGSAALRPLKPLVEDAVNSVILDAYGTDKPDKIDHAKLRQGMLETKDSEIRMLVGIRK